MREDERVFVLGEDIGHFGGPFGVTKGLVEEFGEERLIDTPISEEGVRRRGDRRGVDGRAADRRAAVRRLHHVPVRRDRDRRREDALALRDPAARSSSGRRSAAACAAARSTPRRPEGWFVGTAGLKVVCPGSVEDAYGLLRAAIDDDDPVIYFEHKAPLPPASRRAARAGPPDADRPRPGRPRRARTRRS